MSEEVWKWFLDKEGIAHLIDVSERDIFSKMSRFGTACKNWFPNMTKTEAKNEKRCKNCIKFKRKKK